MPAEATRSRYVLALPGTWVYLPLDDDAALEAQSRALLRRQVGRDDRKARLRRALKDELTRAAASAKNAGSESLALALELAEGVPFGAALTTTTVSWPVDAGSERLPPMERLVAGFPELDAVPCGDGLAVRRTAERSATVDGQESTALAVDYLTPTPHGSLLVIAFSVPVWELPSELAVQLFDAIVSSLAWARS